MTKDPGHQKRRFWIYVALGFCICFGLALIANVQLAGDGDWFWYAKLLRSGTRLYATLNLSLQPFFILETAWFQDAFGEGWVASKIAPTLHLVLLAIAMFILADRSRWSDLKKASLLACGFFVGIRLEVYRFDDYHVVADCLILFAAISAMALAEARTVLRQFIYVIVLGILAGITIVTRLNDGLALACFCLLAVALNAQKKRVWSMLVLSATISIVVAVIVLLTGDSLVTWGVNSLLHAGASKGGESQFLVDPIKILQTAGAYLWSLEAFAVIATIAIALSWTFLVSSLGKRQLRRSTARVTLGLLICCVSLFMLRTEIISGNLLHAVLAVSMFVAYAAALYVAIKAFLNRASTWRWARWQANDILLLLPFMMIGSASLSSGGNFFDLYMPMATLILLLPIAEPFPFTLQWMRTAFTAASVVLAISGISYKFGDPASWINYKTSPLFANRILVDNRIYGPMIIDKPLLTFIGHICSLVNDNEGQPELLSMPFPYANYYCSIPPWDNAVQTWFDSTQKSVINSLLERLEVAPPRWILYQREIGTLSYHELVYNNSQPLPQRALDNFIMSRIAEGQWKVVYREQSDVDSDWILLRTQTVVSRGANLLLNSGAASGLVGWNRIQTAPDWSADSRIPGTYMVRNDSGTLNESILTHPIIFPRNEKVDCFVRIKAADFPSVTTSSGYTVDIYDETAGNIVGSLGYSSTNDVSHDYRFVANVISSHRNVLRLRFSATTGTVYFSHLVIKSSPAPELHTSRSAARVETVQIDDNRRVGLSGWSTPTPHWSFEKRNGGQFTLTVNAAGTIDAELNHAIRFEHDGPVAVQVNVGSNQLDLSAGFGYIVDLYDVTKGTIAGSLGLPAVNSPSRHYSFIAPVEFRDQYLLRLRVQTDSGVVAFSGLKIEYGTIPTP